MPWIRTPISTDQSSFKMVADVGEEDVGNDGASQLIDELLDLLVRRDCFHLLTAIKVSTDAQCKAILYMKDFECTHPKLPLAVADELVMPLALALQEFCRCSSVSIGLSDVRSSPTVKTLELNG